MSPTDISQHFPPDSWAGWADPYHGSYPSQAAICSQSSPTPASPTCDNQENLTDVVTLPSRLFPPLPSPAAPVVPTPNLDNIRQVKIPVHDLYRPLWIRKEGSEREGRCRYCDTWSTLKTSNYSYHMLKRHGVCKAFGQQFPAPRDMQIVDAAAVAAAVTPIGARSDSSGNTNSKRIYQGQRVLLAWCEHCARGVQLAGNPDLERDFARLTASWYSHAKECLLAGDSLE